MGVQTPVKLRPDVSAYDAVNPRVASILTRLCSFGANLLFFIMTDARVETSDLNQDSLDGNSASNSEAGSQDSSPEIVASNEDDNSGESAEVAEESREAEGASASAAEEAATAQTAAPAAVENGTNGVTEHHVNGNNPEADSTEVDGAGEKRKSLAGEEAVSPKKVKVEAGAEEVATVV